MIESFSTPEVEEPFADEGENLQTLQDSFIELHREDLETQSWKELYLAYLAEMLEAVLLEKNLDSNLIILDKFEAIVTILEPFMIEDPGPSEKSKFQEMVNAQLNIVVESLKPRA